MGGVRDEVRTMVPPLIAVSLAINTLYRLAPPFLGEIARDLGVSIAGVGVALSVGELAGALGPLLGRWIDRVPERRSLLVPPAVVAVAGVAGAASPNAVVFGGSLVVAVLAVTAFVAARSAWIGARVDYTRRGRVVGLVETSWAGALLFGIPPLALVVEVSSWRLAYLIAALCIVIGLLWTRASLPHSAAGVGRPPGKGEPIDWRRVAAPVCGFGCLMAASLFVTVVFGVWLEDAFGFSSSEVGGVAFLLGAAELVASLSAMRLTDRWGKVRSIVAGLGLMVPAAVVLAAVGERQVIGIVLLFVFVLGFEFAVVSSLSLLPELQVSARASVLGLALGSGTIGRGVASVVGTRLYSAHGIGSCGFAAAVAAGGAAALFARHERGSTLSR